MRFELTIKLTNCRLGIGVPVEWEAASTGKKSPRKRRGCLIAIAVIILIAIVGGAISRCSGGGSEDLQWPSSGLAQLLPDPPSTKGTVVINDEDQLSVHIDEVSADAYEAYVQECQDKGFTVDIESESDSFDAFTEEGEHLSLSYYSSSERLNIDLEAALEMADFAWPTVGPAASVPVPPSTHGSVTVNSGSQFTATVDGLTAESFNAYADTCMGAGFTVDYDKGDDYFHADNAAGVHVSLMWKRFGMMGISISASMEDASTDTGSTDQADTSAEPTTAETPATDAAPADTGGVSPDFKATMDSYEAFFSEYADFMVAYQANASSPELLAQYADMMARYADMTQSMDSIDENNLSAADYAYYIEVTGRITAKLASVTQ